MLAFKDLANVYTKIADSAYVSGTKLKCSKCNKEEDITKDEFAKYLHKGWPECCKMTMILEYGH